MKCFQFLETTYRDGDETFSMDGESWQEALASYLESLPEISLRNIRNIYRIENSEFKNCREYLNSERNRRMRPFVA